MSIQNLHSFGVKKYCRKAELHTLALAILCAGFGTGKPYADQIINGGFEQPSTTTFTDVVAPDNSTIPGWTVSGGSVDVVNAAGNGYDVGPAYQGAQYLDLNGYAAGTIAETFATTPGTIYRLSFAYANNYNPPTSLTASVTVTNGSGILLSTNVTHASSVSGNLNWSVFIQTFTANQSSATLTFVSKNSGNGGIFLDAISVSPGEVPTLAIASSDNQATVSWTTNAADFHLVSTPSLSPPIHWTAVTNEPVTNGSSFVVTVQATNSAQFFRLELP
jgi:hypothetical protein